MKFEMTPSSFKAIRLKLDMSNDELSRLLNKSTTTLERWQMDDDCANHREIPQTVVLLMKALASGWCPPGFGFDERGRLVRMKVKTKTEDRKAA